MLGVEQAPNILSRQLSAGGKRRRSPTVDVAAIEALDRDDCIERWRQMFGVAPPKYTSLEFMRKVLTYEAQVKAFGGHSNAVQRALKASLKAVRSEIEADSSADANADTNFDASPPAVSASCVERQGVTERPASDAHQSVQHYTGASDASKITKSTRSPKPSKPSVLSIRAGTHLVREWNGRTYQVEALEKGFRLDGKTYRSLSAIAKKITGAHWSGPRFFGLES
jgi:hypothetical protein